MKRDLRSDPHRLPGRSPSSSKTIPPFNYLALVPCVFSIADTSILSRALDKIMRPQSGKRKRKVSEVVEPRSES